MRLATASNYIRQKLTDLQGKINQLTMIAGDLNITQMDRYSRQKINKNIVELKEDINQLDMTDIYIRPLLLESV